MNIQKRLILMNFLEFFTWGSWLISLGAYLKNTLHFTGGQVGSIYGTMGLASLFMPALMGIVADKWINAERVLGLCHLGGGILLLWASTVRDPSTMYWVMLFNAMAYMPTIALNNTVSYRVLEQHGLDIVKIFPPIRVWGTIGFICAMWMVDLSGWNISPLQLYIGAGSAMLLGLYAFTMPSCPPSGSVRGASLSSALGLDAFVLFRKTKMIVFFSFALLLGAALQITNTFGDSFLLDFKSSYPDSFAVKHTNILASVSQISETLFILAIPFFLRRYGIKKVMMMSIFAWVFRFGLFAVGNPGHGMVWLVLSMIIYGMAFDFFNISGSLFVEKEADTNIRASAQGLFMLMTNGLGAFIGGKTSGWVVDYFTHNQTIDWPAVWLTFTGYVLLLGLVFPFLFSYKHEPEVSPQAHH